MPGREAPKTARIADYRQTNCTVTTVQRHALNEQVVRRPLAIAPALNVAISPLTLYVYTLSE
jgi:hypothetical protein